MNFSKISKRFKSCQKNNALKDCGNFNTKNVFKEVSNKIFKGSENFSKIAQSWKFSISRFEWFLTSYRFCNGFISKINYTWLKSENFW